MAKRINAQLAKARKQWDEERRHMQERLDAHMLSQHGAEAQAEELAAQLTKTRDELHKQVATSARLGGENDGLKLAMRMLANTIIGKETYSSWPWQAPESK
jgi:23S rRNA pseudoU1915 N3-methylase RlmH